jgi:glycerate 2-kinase
MAAGVRDVAVPGVAAVEVAVADGGDGTLDVLLAATPGSHVETLRVTGPLGASVDARLGWLSSDAAVVEMAEAAGLRLVPPGSRDALRATTHGVGELIRTALDRGARRIVVGVGGSATTDGGAGLAAALGARLLDARGADFPPGGGALGDLDRLDLGGLDPRLRTCRVEVAVDVRSPLLGPFGSAAVFGPQKGASVADVAALEAALAHYADVVCAEVGADPARSAEPGMGAAGGAAFGLALVCGAVLVPGAALVCDLVGLDAALRGAALVLTGEGRLDSSTSAGKAPAEVALRAAEAGVPCVVLAGSVEQPVAPAYAEAVAIGAGLPLAEALARTAELLRQATAAVISKRFGAPAR